jgi:predicted permease
MAPGATFEQATAEVATVYTRLQDEYPEAYGRAYNYRTEMIPFKQALGQDARLTLWLLMGAAAFVLIIAVANVANLSLMRRVRREHELLVRASLGAGVARLRRLLLAENLVLSIAGAVLGTIVAIAAVPALVSLANRYTPRASEIRLDGPVLLFTLGVAIGVAFLLSFVTSLPSEEELAMVSSGGHRSTGGRRKQRLQRALVVVQVAVSVVLLAGAGLLTRTMVRIADVETGLRSEEVLTMEVTFLTRNELRGNPEAEGATRTLFTRIRDEIAGLPGVTAVATGSLPLGSAVFQNQLLVEGRPVGTGEAVPFVEVRLASPNYFSSSGIPLLRGRSFTAFDEGASEYVAIVNQEFVDRLFPGEDPIGKRVTETNQLEIYRSSDPAAWIRIVGVVGNTRDHGLDAPPRATIFRPQTDERATDGGLVIRTEHNAAALAAPATAIIRRLAPTAAIERVKTIAQVKDESVAPRRLNAALVSSFGLLAVLIAAVGIAGVLAFAVSLRTNEIGIRMSLGADSARVQRMILKEGGTLVVVGLAIGSALGLGASNVIRGLLFGVEPHDPATFAAVVVLMAAIGVAACWIPAVRAARIDPAATLRAE